MRPSILASMLTLTLTMPAFSQSTAGVDQQVRACKAVGFIAPLLRLPRRRSQGGTRNSACGRRLRACHSARRCAR